MLGDLSWCKVNNAIVTYLKSCLSDAYGKLGGSN